ncbi:MAG: DUF2059 domain-containing protein [Allorhizobium sp.]
MITFSGFGRIASSAILVVMLGTSAHAQEVSEEQVQAARAALTSLGVTNQFDNILPGLAERLKAELTQVYPNFQDQIFATVDETALSLASRRGDLEREAALVYAKAFTVDELKAISAFYESDAGKKMLKDGPIATREMMKAADIWASGIGRDLQSKTNEAMVKIAGDSAAVPGAAAAVAPADAPKP